MRTTIIVFLFILNCIVNAASQVKLYPEIGFSFMPYEISTLSHVFAKKNSLDLIFGIKGKVKFSNSIFLDVRLGSSFRSQSKSGPFGISSDYLGSEYKNKELNIDLTINSILYKSSSLGAGLGLIHKLNSTIIENYTDNQKYQDVLNKYIYSLNITYIYSFPIIDVNIRYFRNLSNILTNSYYAKQISMPNRIDLTMSLKIFNK